MAADSSISLNELVAQLSGIAETAPAGTLVTINGEYIRDLSFWLQRPVGRYSGGEGPVELAVDPTRHSVLDLGVNGRSGPEMPTIDYPYRRPAK